MSKMRIISIETMQKLEGMYRLVRSITSKCDPLKMDTEPSFQEQFYNKAQEKFKNTDFVIYKEIKTPFLSTSRSKCVSDSDVNYWKVDFIIKVDNAIIPVELKLRHKGQDINGYAQDYIDDVDKVRELIINYDDCPECYAIMLTDNEKLKQQCDDKAKEYSSENKLVDKRTVSISWTTINNYYIGIIGRVQTNARLNNIKDKEFVFLSDNQEHEFDWESFLEELYNEDEDLDNYE